MNSLPASVKMLAARYKSQRSSISSGPTLEGHDLQSLSRRIMLSPAETLEQVSNGSLIALSSANGKHVFSSAALDRTRNRVVSFIAESVCIELGRRGCDEETMVRACARAFERQHELSRRADNIVEFARDDDDNQTARNAALLAGGAAAGYGVAKYLRNRNGNNGNALPPGSGSAQPQLPGGPRTPRDPNSSFTGGSGVETHPGSRSASIIAPITTASSTTRKTVGNSVVDPLADAVASGRKAIARKGSAIWQALRGIPLE